MAAGACARWRPLLLPPLPRLLLVLAAAGAGRSAGLYPSDAAEDAAGQYGPFLGRLLAGRLRPSREEAFGLQSLDGGGRQEGEPYETEPIPIDDDWVEIGPGRGSMEERYEPTWSDDDWPPVPPPPPPGALPDSDESDPDWVQIGSPEDGLWADHWQDDWPERRDEDRPEPDWSPLGRSGAGVAESEEETQEQEQEQDKGHTWEEDVRPDPAAAEGDTARQLHAIRQAFLQQAETPPAGQQQPRAAALRAPSSDRRITMDKRRAASAAGAGDVGRQRYMPWLLIAGIAVGSVAAVLGAIFVGRRVRGGPGKVVSQQWIPHHVLRMATGSSDIQPTAGEPTGEPVRIKAKGLLERRCSSSSLTIQLQPGEEDGEPIVVSSPATHSEAAEYLASAGNRLSRRELRQTEESVAALQAEFWDIPLNFPDKCDIVGASTKNRYKTVMPNEHTRVTLPGVNQDPLSAYINANWIRGYDSEERAYIATQGPLAHTLEDFWQMVLSRRAPAIVMITKLRENGRIKCAGYLPETRQKATFGKIEVTVKRILPRNGYTLRYVTVKRGKEQLQLQHFWFTAWPDHRTPDDSQQLLQLAAEVEGARRDSEGNPTGPVVVHCSAGIGRTGCFIAVSIGTSQLMEEDGVDVLGIVCGMRRDRGGMVQTAEQYIFIHRALRDLEASLPALEGPVRSSVN